MRQATDVCLWNLQNLYILNDKIVSFIVYFTYFPRPPVSSDHPGVRFLQTAFTVFRVFNKSLVCELTRDNFDCRLLTRKPRAGDEAEVFKMPKGLKRRD